MDTYRWEKKQNPKQGIVGHYIYTEKKGGKRKDNIKKRISCVDLPHIFCLILVFPGFRISLRFSRSKKRKQKKKKLFLADRGMFGIPLFYSL